MLGHYPLLSLTAARAKRDEARKQLLDGMDPNIEKRLKIDSQLASARNTFEKVARVWHELSKAHWAKVHAGDVLRSLERDVFPAIVFDQEHRARLAAEFGATFLDVRGLLSRL